MAVSEYWSEGGFGACTVYSAEADAEIAKKVQDEELRQISQSQIR